MSQVNYSAAVFIMDAPGIRAIKVRYDPNLKNGNKDVIAKTFDETIQVDDYVVVRTDTRHNMTVVRVVDVDVDVDVDHEDEIKWIVGRVDTKNYEQLQAQEDELIQRVKSSEKERRKKELRAAFEAGGMDVKSLPFHTTTLENGE